jgi:DNA polymerase-3 subunit delta
VEFAPLTADRVLKWITYHAQTALGRPITGDAATLLIEAVGTDLAQLAVELEKLASYSTHEINEAAVSAVVGVRRGESVGALLDAVAARDAAAALSLVPGVLQQPKTTAVSIVMNLTTQTLAMAYGVAARDAGSSPRAMFNEYMGLLKETGAFPGRPWGEAVNAWTKHTDRWRAHDLDAALSALLAADAALKETRLSSEEQLLTSLVLTLCGTGAPRRAA